MDAVVTASGLRTPAIRIVREGRILPASSFTRAASIAGQALTGLVDARRVLDEVRGGATVVLQGLHRYWPPLTDLITALERELGHPCQANAYLTPAGSQGFAPHRDTHDVFVVQSEGAKTWRLGEEGEEEEVELHPGRVLYLPTGTRHSARAQDDLSLHVTIGINQFTWRALVRRALLASLDEIEDGHLPAGWLDDPTEVVEGLRQRLAAVAEQLATSDPTTVVVAHEQDFLTSRPPRLAGGLVDALRGDDVDDDTPLRRRSTSTAVLRASTFSGSIRNSISSFAAVDFPAPGGATSTTARSSVALAERAGGLLDEIVPSIAKTSALVQEIAAASGEQTSGLAQISTAMSTLNQTTQQNASATEELAATSKELRGKADQLQQAMAFFHLTQEFGGAGSHRARAH